MISSIVIIDSSDIKNDYGKLLLEFLNKTKFKVGDCINIPTNVYFKSNIVFVQAFNKVIESYRQQNNERIIINL